MEWNEFTYDFDRVGEYQWILVLSMWPGYGLVNHLKVRRANGQDGITWDVLQEIKNGALGKEAIAIEVYPRQQELVDHANYRHLFEVPYGVTVPSL